MSEVEESEQVLFQGPMFGRETNLKKNPRLVQAGLIPAKRMISDALSRRAHSIVAEIKGPRLAVRFVVDGIVYPAGTFPGKQGMAVVQTIKLLSGLDVQSRGEPQSGGILGEFNGQEYHLLVDTSPVKGVVERLRIRIEDPKVSFVTPTETDFPGSLKTKLQTMSSPPPGDDALGIILSCGGAESGATSLSLVAMHCMDPYLYSVFNFADVGGKRLVNVAEPDDEPGLDLEIKLDRIIRKEGDAVYLGKFDDPQQVQLLFDYSDRLCFFGEIGVRKPAEAVSQLIDWVGTDKVLSGLKAVISQKLIRRLCDDCKQAFRPRPQLLKQLGLPRETTVLYRAPTPPPDDDLNAPSLEELCAECNGSPYHGRVPAYEMFEMTDEMKEFIVAGGVDAKAIRQQMIREKQLMLQQDALRLVVNGTTSLEEVKRAFTPPRGVQGKRRRVQPQPRRQQ
ncbi:MAG: Flp pilus assembly complex ATPase component TadA [Fuerstiella sp.]|nr:Flp pilus assembly complex ATPase component TadA [Fuerstiella sp.]